MLYHRIWQSLSLHLQEESDLVVSVPFRKLHCIWQFVEVIIWIYNYLSVINLFPSYEDTIFFMLLILLVEYGAYFKKFCSITICVHTKYVIFYAYLLSVGPIAIYETFSIYPIFIQLSYKQFMVLIMIRSSSATDNQLDQCNWWYFICIWYNDKGTLSTIVYEVSWWPHILLSPVV